MTDHPPTREPLPRLWGWSWRGWIALGVLGAMLAAMAGGVDLRFQIQKLIHPLGWRAHNWFIGRYLWDQYWAAWSAGFGLVSLCWMLPALHVGPVRRRAWTYAALAAWALIGPALRHIQFSAMTTPGTWLSRLLPSGPWPNGAFAISIAMSYLPSLAIVWAATRSWRLALALSLSAGVMIVPTGHIVFTKLSNTQSMMLAGATNAVLAGVVLAWAIRARKRGAPAHACRACGYDLTGLAIGVCPECGTPRGEDEAARPAR